MFDNKKSMDLLYYLSVSNKVELDKDKKVMFSFRKDLPRPYREVFDYIYETRNSLSEEGKKIYSELLGIKK